MARTDAVQFFLELAAEWRRLGAEVTFEPGWERRGNGTSPAYEGGIVHHTAFLSSFANPFPARNTLINGRTDLSGPLCNVAGPVSPIERPRLHIVAAFPANHAGASGGRSMGPLPVSSLFNRLVVGLEVDYAGLTPMIGGQYVAAIIFARGLANVLRRSTEYVRAHMETSVTGKWDPGYANGKTYDMAAFRRNAANFTSAGGFLVALNDQQQNELYQNTKYLRDAFLLGGGDASPSGRPLKDLIQAAVDNTMGISRVDDPNADPKTGLVSLRQEVADAKTLALALTARQAAMEEALRTVAAAGSSGIDVEALLTRIDERVTTSVAAGLAEGVDVDITVGGQTA